MLWALFIVVGGKSKVLLQIDYEDVAQAESMRSDISFITGLRGHARSSDNNTASRKNENSLSAHGLKQP